MAYMYVYLVYICVRGSVVCGSGNGRIVVYIFAIGCGVGAKFRLWRRFVFLWTPRLSMF